MRQADTLTIDAATRTGPGTVAGRFMRRFWHPVAMADEIAIGKAKTLKILGEDFTLYRGESGTPFAIAHRCPHRGTQLSLGVVMNDCLRCLYHGWRFDGNGDCVDQPAEKNENFARKVHIRSYPTSEYIGLIFVYFGEDEPPPRPRFPEFEAEGLLYPTAYVRLCNFFQNVENSCDPTHVPFTHTKTFESLNFDIPRLEAEETEYGLINIGRRGENHVRASHVMMPNIYSSKLPSPDERITEWPLSIAWRVPIDDVSHKGIQVYYHAGHPVDPADFAARRKERMDAIEKLRPANEVATDIVANKLDLFDPAIMDRPDYVNIQDHVAQMGQGPIADRRSDRLGIGDTAVILLRKLWLRELNALADGRPLTEWRYPQELDRRSGVAV